MLEISTIYDPAGAERARRQEVTRLELALGKPAISSTVDISEHQRREANKATAEAGLMAVAKHLGLEAVRPTAELLGISLEE